MGDVEANLNLLENVGAFRDEVAESRRQAILRGNRRPQNNNPMEIEEYNRLGQQAQELLQQAGLLQAARQNPFQLDAQEQNFGPGDLKIYKPKKFAAGSKGTFLTGLTNYVDAIPDRFSKRIKENANVYWPQGDEIPPQASDEQIAHYFATKVPPDALPQNLKVILQAVFPTSQILMGPLQFSDFQDQNAEIINPELRRFAKMGFRVYERKSPGPMNNLGVRIGTTTSRTVRPTAKYMAKATNAASPYERVVLGQARRIIKRLMSSLAASKMNIKTLNKSYEVQKGDYNKYKYLLPGPRINKLKNWARKYGTTIPADVKAAQVANNAEYITKLTNSLDDRIAKFDDGYKPYLQRFNTQDANSLIARIPLVRKKELQ